MNNFPNTNSSNPALELVLHMAKMQAQANRNSNHMDQLAQQAIQQKLLQATSNQNNPMKPVIDALKDMGQQHHMNAFTQQKEVDEGDQIRKMIKTTLASHYQNQHKQNQQTFDNMLGGQKAPNQFNSQQMLNNPQYPFAALSSQSMKLNPFGGPKQNPFLNNNNSPSLFQQQQHNGNQQSILNLLQEKFSKRAFAKQEEEPTSAQIVENSVKQEQSERKVSPQQISQQIDKSPKDNSTPEPQERSVGQLSQSSQIEDLDEDDYSSPKKSKKSQKKSGGHSSLKRLEASRFGMGPRKKKKYNEMNRKKKLESTVIQLPHPYKRKNGAEVWEEETMDSVPFQELVENVEAVLRVKILKPEVVFDMLVKVDWDKKKVVTNYKKNRVHYKIKYGNEGIIEEIPEEEE